MEENKISCPAPIENLRLAKDNGPRSMAFQPQREKVVYPNKRDHAEIPNHRSFQDHKVCWNYGISGHIYYKCSKRKHQDSRSYIRQPLFNRSPNRPQYSTQGIPQGRSQASIQGRPQDRSQARH